MTASTQTATRREQARVKKNGKFGNQPHTESEAITPIHGDEIRTQVSEAVADAMGGPWMLEPGMSTYVVQWSEKGVQNAVTVNMVEIGRGPYATPDVAARISRLLPNLPADRVERHAEQIAQAHVMVGLYNHPVMDRVKLLTDLEMSAASDQLLLANRESFQSIDGYDWDEWSEEEASLWEGELFLRLSAAVDENRRLEAGIAA